VAVVVGHARYLLRRVAVVVVQVNRRKTLQ
jgi:hypothetical protein